MSKCKSCKYRAANDNPWECEYICIVGHSRGCEPGDLCTKYDKGDRLLSSFMLPIIFGHSKENSNDFKKN